MSDQELRDELMTMLIAGHETTATALSWAFERLLRQPGGTRACAGLEGDDDYARRGRQGDPALAARAARRRRAGQAADHGRRRTTSRPA